MQARSLGVVSGTLKHIRTGLLGMAGLAIISAGSVVAQDVRPGGMQQRAVGSGEPMIYKVAKQTGGVIEFEIDEYDLGVISDTEKIDYSVNFTNTGDEVLTIERTVGGCGCMVADLEKKVYLPGETGTLELTFDPTGREGAQVKPVKVYYAGSREPAQFTLRSTIEPTIRRPRGVNLREIVLGQGGDGQFAITTKRDNVEVKKVEVINPQSGMLVSGDVYTGPGLKAKVKSVEEIEMGEDETGTRIVIGVEVLKEVPLGTLFRQVRVTLEMDSEDGTERETRDAETAVNANIVGDIRALPSRIQWRRAMAGTPVNQQVRLNSRTGREFKITDMEWLSEEGTLRFRPELTNEIYEQPNGEPLHIVNIAGTFPTDRGTIRGTLIIFTDMEDNPEVVIPVFGAVQERRINIGGRRSGGN